ncbi:hypothetical protein RvY_14916-2 [Ramazzottius varieornatus]|uniref:Uncharacterized protein n=1 Tax=Ramazzottius varieornatus TaxID=947166 RepID=A0A1D1VUP5_RAMVA|nr:hypothetical protein RvY_14916-2 [Ramazzottius varieornatus]
MQLGLLEVNAWLVSALLPGSSAKFLSFGILVSATTAVEHSVPQSTSPVVQAGDNYKDGDLRGSPQDGPKHTKMDFHPSFEGMLSTDNEPFRCLDKSADPTRTGRIHTHTHKQTVSTFN